MTARVLDAGGPTVYAAAAAEAELASLAPELVAGFRSNLVRAADVVARRLVGAAQREGLNGEPGDLAWSGDRAFLPFADGGYLVARASRHAFNRVEVEQVVDAEPAALLARIAGASAATDALAAELTNACVNLALAYARRDSVALDPAYHDSLDLTDGLDADAQALVLERLGTAGHNLHPCGRTRLGWSVADTLAHDLETEATQLGFVAVRRDLHIGDDVGRRFIDVGLDPDQYAVTPVHQWQLDRVIRHRYADLVDSGALVALDQVLAVHPTAALRTVLLPADPDGRRRYLKVSLDILVTSTRRSISVASTRNATTISALVEQLLDQTGTADRVLLLEETAGAAMVAPAGERDLGAIVRTGLAGRLHPGELPVPAAALGAPSPVSGRPVVAELVDRYARASGLPPTAAAARFVEEYARLLLTPVLALATRGVGFEAHLQNCVPTFVDGAPYRLGLRDLAGMRLHPARLGRPVNLWPGSVVLTDDVDVMRAKVAYTALQANLGEIVLQLGRSVGLGAGEAWSAVRRVVDEIYDSLGEAAGDDHAYFTAPTLPHKALLRMRLAAARGQTGDIYVRVENPLR